MGWLMHDAPNVFGFRHEVDAGRFVGGGFVFVAVVVVGVCAFFRRVVNRTTPIGANASNPSIRTNSDLVDAVVRQAKEEYISRTGASPVPVRTWKKER